MNTLRKAIGFSLLLLGSWSYAQTNSFNLQIEGDSVLCPGDTLLLTALPSEEAQLLWSTGGSDSTIVITEAMQYSVQAINSTGDTANAVWTVTTLDFPEVDIFVSGRLECPDDQVSLSVPFSVTTEYEWSTFQTNNLISVGSPGEYSVLAYNQCGEARDTVMVESDNKPYPIAEISADSTEICEGDSVVLRLNLNSEGFWFWSEGFAFVDSIVVDTPGEYWVNFINDCGTVTEFIEIRFPPPIEVAIEGPSKMCQGEEITLNAISNTALAYRWSDGSTETSFSTSFTGDYSVSVSDKCDEEASASQRVQEIPPPSVTIQVSEPLLCEEDQVQVRADTAWTNSLLWETGDTAIAIFPMEIGVYSVQAFNECFSTQASARVQSIRVPVYLPNVFSPNNDGNNDFFLPHLACENVQDYEFRIFSRWGDPVFFTNDYLEWWDGSKNGIQDAPSGVYVWFLQFKIRERTYYFDGDVFLMR